MPDTEIANHTTSPGETTPRAAQRWRGWPRAPLLILLLVGAAAALGVTRVRWAFIVQVVLLPALALLTMIPGFSAAIARRLDQIRYPAPRRQAWTALAIAVLACGYLLFTGLRQHRDLFPKYHDENMHLVQVQLLAHGRLWREPHPLADALETHHVLIQPVYASIYFPGTALFHIPAVWLGLPWWVMPLLAAGASVGLLYHNVTDLLDGAYAALAVLLLLAASQFRFLSLVVMSHGVMILLSMALLWAYLRWHRRDGSWPWTLALGAIAGWAAVTRPVDAICWAAPIGLAMLLDLRGRPLRRWLATGALLVVAAAPLLSLQLALNVAVSGSLFTTPYRYAADVYNPQVGYGVRAFDPTVRPRTTLEQKIVYFDAFTVPALHENATRSAVERLVRERLGEFAYFTVPGPLVVPLLFVGVLGLEQRRWLLWVPILLFVAAYATFPYFIPNYMAVYATAMAFAVVMGARAIVEAFPAARDKLVTFLTGAIVVMCFSMLPEINPTIAEDNRPTPTMALNARLEDGVVMIDGRPGRIRQPAVVLFKYHRWNNPHEEPVYTTTADWPDDAKIIRAHDLGTAKNLELLKYFAERQPERNIYFCDRADNSIAYKGRADALWAAYQRRPATRSTSSPATSTPPTKHAAGL
jgi:hypothetical protein